MSQAIMYFTALLLAITIQCLLQKGISLEGSLPLSILATGKNSERPRVKMVMLDLPGNQGETDQWARLGTVGPEVNRASKETVAARERMVFTDGMGGTAVKARRGNPEDQGPRGALVNKVPRGWPEQGSH